MPPDNDQRPLCVSGLEKKLGVSFDRKDLLRLALTHSSYINESRSSDCLSNERLEFLGDAVIGMTIADEFYRRNPSWTEGELTQTRASLVSGEALADAALNLDIGGYLLMGRGEEASGGRERPNNLAAALEAVVGALFLDKGYESSLELVIRVIANGPSVDANSGHTKNPKSVLQEAVQSRGLEPPAYRIVGTAGRNHAREFTAEVTVDGLVVGKGTGRRKSLAEREAASDAARTLDI